MSNISETPWSTNPNAPNIPFWLYQGEKGYFAGFLIDAILYGIVIVLFFRCIGAFLDPVNRTIGGVGNARWGVIVHTVAMFSFATAYIAMASHIQFMSFIDNRQFHASTGGVPGPVEYQFFIHSTAMGIAPIPLLLCNNWLSSGLLLYRCYIVYSGSYWAVAFPFLMYLTSLAMGVMFVYENSRPDLVLTNFATAVPFGAPFFSISFALNILVTILIVGRLVLHVRSQRAMGAADAGGPYAAIAAMIIESYALCAVAVTLYLIAWGAGSFLQYVFLQVIAQMQVIAPFLIILRVANRRAVTINTTLSTNTSSVHSGAQGKRRCDSETLPSGYRMSSMDTSELGYEDVITIGHHDGASDSKESLKS